MTEYLVIIKILLGSLRVKEKSECTLTLFYNLPVSGIGKRK